MFYIGQKIVCIDANYPKKNHKLHSQQLVLNEVYTIRGFSPDTQSEGLYLEEIHSVTHSKTGFEIGFKCVRFKPVVKTEFDLSIFTQILSDNRVKEDA